MSETVESRLQDQLRIEREKYEETLDILTEVSKELHAKEEEIKRLKSERESFAERVRKLEKALEITTLVIEALKVQKDPDNPPIPWPQAKAEMRVQELGEEVEHLKEQLASTTWRASLPHASYNKEIGSE